MSTDLSVAYGERGVAKLVELLRGEHSGGQPLSAEDSATALQLIGEQLPAPETAAFISAQRASNAVAGGRTRALGAAAGDLLPVLLQLIKAHGSPSVRAAAADVFAAQMPLLQARKALVAQPGALAMLCQAVASDADATVRAHVAGALDAFTLNNDGVAPLAADAAALAAAVRGVDNTPAVLAALANIAGTSDAAANALLGAGAMQPVLRALTKFGDKDVTVTRAGLLTLRGLVNSEPGKAQALAAGAVPITLKHATSRDELARRAAVGAVALLALHLPARSAYLATGAALTGAMHAALRDADVLVTIAAAAAVRHLAEAPEGMRVFTRVLVSNTRLFVRVFGSAPACKGACEQLVAMLASRDVAAEVGPALDVILALLQSSSHGDAHAALADSLHVADNLAMLAYDNSSGTSTATAGKARVAIDLLSAVAPDFASTITELVQ